MNRLRCSSPAEAEPCLAAPIYITNHYTSFSIPTSNPAFQQVSPSRTNCIHHHFSPEPSKQVSAPPWESPSPFWVWLRSMLLSVLQLLSPWISLWFLYPPPLFSHFSFCSPMGERQTETCSTAEITVYSTDVK